MKIEHIKSNKLLVNKWSGGTTTQLAIYPKDADYKKRNFLFRVSTASVESEESVFTKLPGVSRKLMILDGEIKIEHKNQYSKTIKKFEQDGFSGDWETKSHGKAIDFNLMTTGLTQGKIEGLLLNQPENISLDTSFNYYGFYIYKNNVNLTCGKEFLNLLEGDFVLIDTENKNIEISIDPKDSCEIILSKISIWY